MSLPTLTIEAWLNGAYVDVTQYGRSFKTSRGRSRPLEDYAAGRATVTLGNRDARFDPTNLSGPYVTDGATTVLPMAPIRIRATWNSVIYDLWAGFADSWDTTYPGLNRDAVTTVEATDGFKVLNAFQNPDSIGPPTFVSSTIQSVSADNVDVVTPTGVQEGDILIAGFAASNTVFTVEPPAGWTPRFQSLAVGPIGTVTHTRVVGASEPSTHHFVFDSSQSVATACVAYRGSSDVVKAVEGHGSFTSSISPGPVESTTPNTRNVFWSANHLGTGSWVPSIPTGYAQRVGYTVTGGVSVALCDVAQNVAGPVPQNPPTERLPYSSSFGAHYFVLGPAPLGEGEDTGARVARILDNAGWSATDRALDVGDSTLQSTLLTDVALSEIRSVVDSEQGYLYMSGAGEVVFKRRTSRITDTRSKTVQATFGTAAGQLHYSDVVLAYDDLLIKNTVTATRKHGVTQTASDSASLTSFLPRSHISSDLWLELDANAELWAQWIVLLYKDPELRVESITIKPQSNTALWPVALGLDIGDLVEIEHVTPAGNTVDRLVFVEGVSHSYDTQNEWTTKFTFSSATIHQSTGWLIFDDANLGKFDTGRFAV